MRQIGEIVQLAVPNATARDGQTQSLSPRQKELLGARIDASLSAYWQPDLEREATAFAKREWFDVLKDIDLQYVDMAFTKYAKAPLNETASGKPLAPHKSQIRQLAIAERDRADQTLRLPTMSESDRAKLWQRDPMRAARQQAIWELKPGLGGMDYVDRRARDLYDAHIERSSQLTEAGSAN